jgi:LAO/AO transport system kinase
VLVATAATGEGVAELLAAIDRHRTTSGGDHGDSARLVRAEAQVWGVLADRLRERARSIEAAPVATELLRAVADHRLDPYAAADRLLRLMVEGNDTECD